MSESADEKFIIVRSETKIVRFTVRGQSAVHEVQDFWTGAEWTKGISHALTFDSQAAVDDYIEDFRTTLESF